MSEPKYSEIALVDKFDKLKPERSFGDIPEIEVTIAVKSAKNTPQNFDLHYNTPKSSVGGCHARIFASEYGSGSNANIFNSYGPDVGKWGGLNDYQHGLRALDRIAKREEKMRQDRGYTSDAAEAMGRWLEACGVREVFMRPAEYNKRDGWLDRGEWEVLTVGQFINRVRQNLYVAPVPVETTAAVEASA